jgi:hypothetical protein
MNPPLGTNSCSSTKSEDSSMCSQDPASGPYPMPHQSNPHPPILLLKDPSNVLPCMSRSSYFLSPSGFITKLCMHLSPMRVTCPAQVILDLERSEWQEQS